MSERRDCRQRFWTYSRAVLRYALHSRAQYLWYLDLEETLLYTKHNKLSPNIETEEFSPQLTQPPGMLLLGNKQENLIAMMANGKLGNGQSFSTMLPFPKQPIEAISVSAMHTLDFSVFDYTPEQLSTFAMVISCVSIYMKSIF